MHLIVCVDDRYGISFCGKRLSSDRQVVRSILQLTADKYLWVSPYSAALFPEGSVLIDEDFTGKARPEDYCFLETAPLPGDCSKFQSVILYRWNRHYPSTVKFPVTLLDTMTLQESVEFPGSSHEKITMERYSL